MNEPTIVDRWTADGKELRILSLIETKGFVLQAKLLGSWVNPKSGGVRIKGEDQLLMARIADLLRLEGAEAFK